MTRMTGPDCVVMCNLINTHTHTHTHTHTRGSREEAQGAQGLCKNPRESVFPLSRRVLSDVFVTSIIDRPVGRPIRVA